MTAAEGAVVVASLSVIASSVAAFASRATKRKVSEATEQVVENNGWAKTTSKSLEALQAELHEMRGEMRQWRVDHMDQGHPKRRPRG